MRECDTGSIVTVTVLAVILAACTLLAARARGPLPRDQFSAATLTPQAADIVNRICVSPSGHRFSTKLLLADPGTPGQCLLNDNALGLLSDAVGCEPTPDDPSSGWINPIGRASKYMADRGGPLVLSKGVYASVPACMLSFGPASTSDVETRFEDDARVAGGLVSAGALDMPKRAQAQAQAQAQARAYSINPPGMLSLSYRGGEAWPSYSFSIGPSSPPSESVTWSMSPYAGQVYATMSSNVATFKFTGGPITMTVNASGAGWSTSLQFRVGVTYEPPPSIRLELLDIGGTWVSPEWGNIIFIFSSSSSGQCKIIGGTFSPYGYNVSWLGNGSWRLPAFNAVIYKFTGNSIGSTMVYNQENGALVKTFKKTAN